LKKDIQEKKKGISIFEKDAQISKEDVRKKIFCI
jgi:hypothetical protein